jgi:hypothetical protein
VQPVLVALVPLQTTDEPKTAVTTDEPKSAGSSMLDQRLQELAAMGFTDRARNATLLVQ